MYAKILREPWVLERRIIANANDANDNHRRKHSCCQNCQCLSQRTFKCVVESSIVRWFHIYQCLLVSAWIELSKFFVYYFPMWTFHSSWSGIFIAFQSSCSLLFLHLCILSLPLLLALLFLPQWSLGYERWGKELDVSLLFLCQIRIRKNCVHVWELAGRVGLCVCSLYCNNS